MSMTEYDVALRAIVRDPWCAPMLADMFEDAGMERLAYYLRWDGFTPADTTHQLADRAHQFMDSQSLEYFQAVLYRSLMREHDNDIYWRGERYYVLKTPGGDKLVDYNLLPKMRRTTFRRSTSDNPPGEIIFKRP